VAVISSKGAQHVNILRRIVVGIAGAVVVALALELVAPKAVHAVASALVTVSNTSSNPVPVTGGVAVTNTVPVSGSVNATVTSLPAVQLSGTPTVNVASMPNVTASIGGNVPVTNPLDGNGNPIPLVTQNPVSATNAFDVLDECNVPEGQHNCSGTIYTVPAGKMAVIQSMSANCQLPAGQNMTLLAINYLAPGGSGDTAYMQPGPLLASFNGEFVSISQEHLTAYAVGGNSGSNISFAAVTNGGSGADCFLELAGYLVNQ
jgi:hypothetical protein